MTPAITRPILRPTSRSGEARGQRARWWYFPVFLVAMFMALFVVYGFDTAPTFGEETIGASKQAPRGILTAIRLSGAIGAIFLLAIILSFKDMPAAIQSAQAFGLPIGDTIRDQVVQAADHEDPEKGRLEERHRR